MVLEAENFRMARKIKAAVETLNWHHDGPDFSGLVEALLADCEQTGRSPLVEPAVMVRFGNRLLLVADHGPERFPTTNVPDDALSIHYMRCPDKSFQRYVLRWGKPFPKPPVGVPAGDTWVLEGNLRWMYDVADIEGVELLGPEFKKADVIEGWQFTNGQGDVVALVRCVGIDFLGESVPAGPMEQERKDEAIAWMRRYLIESYEELRGREFVEELPAVEDRQLKLLQCLFEARPKQLTKTALAGAAVMDRHSVKRHLDELAQKKLVKLPPPKSRAGVVITDLGCRAVSSKES